MQAINAILFLIFCFLSFGAYQLKDYATDNDYSNSLKQNSSDCMARSVFLLQLRFLVEVKAYIVILGQAILWIDQRLKQQSLNFWVWNIEKCPEFDFQEIQNNITQPMIKSYNNQVSMPKQLSKFNYGDEDYQIEKAPKRCNYRKIKINIKQQMIKRHFEEGQSISDLSKLFHLSYSTIVYILKTYKEKNIVFDSKSSKMMREAQEQIKTEHPKPNQKLAQEEQLKQSLKVDWTKHYPFTAFWAFYCV